MADAKEQAFVAPPLPERGGIVTPFQFVLTGEENLRLSIWLGTVNFPQAAVIIAGRQLQPGNPTPFAFSKAFAFDDTNPLPQGFDFPMGRGPLLNVVAFPFNCAPERGQMYVRLDVIRGIGRGATLLGTLIQGYITSPYGRAWPGSALEMSTEGPGHLVTVAGATPAAGAEPSITIPDTRRWRIISVLGGLNCSGAAANRAPFLGLRHKNTLFFQGQSSLVQVAGSGANHYWAAGNDAPQGTGATIGRGPLPHNVQIATSGASQIAMLMATAGLQAGDQWTALTAMIEEWINAATYPPF